MYDYFKVSKQKTTKIALDGFTNLLFIIRITPTNPILQKETILKRYSKELQ